MPAQQIAARCTISGELKWCGLYSRAEVIPYPEQRQRQRNTAWLLRRQRRQRRRCATPEPAEPCTSSARLQPPLPAPAAQDRDAWALAVLRCRQMPTGFKQKKLEEQGYNAYHGHCQALDARDITRVYVGPVLYAKSANRSARRAWIGRRAPRLRCRLRLLLREAIALRYKRRLWL